jgi:hypothetical protein
MGHYLQALVLPIGAWEYLDRRPAPTHPVQIHSSLLLVPLTDELYDYLVDGDGAGNLYGDIFSKWHPAIEAFASEVSGVQPYAYIETEYFGGHGVQAAGAWRQSGTLIEPANGPIGPINEVLRALGVDSPKPRDEFDAVGLSRHRHTEDWLNEPRFGHAVVPAPSSRKARRLAFDQPQSVSWTTLRVLSDVIAQVQGVRDAFVVRCSINGEAAENVLVVGLDEGVASEPIMSKLMPKLRLLLASHEHLDVLPFPAGELPEGLHRTAYRVPVQLRRRRWWRFWE